MLPGYGIVSRYRSASATAWAYIFSSIVLFSHSSFIATMDNSSERVPPNGPPSQHDNNVDNNGNNNEYNVDDGNDNEYNVGNGNSNDSNTGYANNVGNDHTTGITGVSRKL